MGNYCSTATESAQEKKICTKKNGSSAMKRKKRNLQTKETTHAKSNVELKKLNEDIEKGKGRQFQGEERRLKCESPQVIFQNQSEEEVQGDDVVDAIYYDRFVSSLLRQIDDLTKDVNKYKEQARNKNTQYCYVCSEKEKMDARMRRLETQLEEVRDENRQLLNRLSKNASMKLNITDLGDHNRPEKLAEQFSELYDNQWTEGFDLLTTNLKMKDKDAILSLLNIVQLIYETCLSKAENLEQKMHTTLALYLGQEHVSKGDADYSSFREKVMYTIRDFRGQNYYMSMNDVRKDIKQRLRENMDEKIRKLCKEFISECSRVCWLMCIKNPPMHLTSESGILFNEDIYRSYTAKGPYIAYVVWPVLHLNKHGPLLKKGVAQGKIKKPKSAKAEDNIRDHAKEDPSLSPNSTSVHKRRNSDPFSVTHFKVHEVDTRRFASTSVTPKTSNKADGCPTVTPGFIKADQTLRKGRAQGKIKKTTPVKGEENTLGHTEEVESSAPNSTSVDKVLSNDDLKYNDKEVSDVRVRKRRNSDPLSVKHSKVHDVDT